MSKRIECICLCSVAKIMPIIYLKLGFLIALGSYIYLKIANSATAPTIGFWAWIFAILLYTALFCVILSLLTFVGVLAYNWLSKRIGGVQICLADDKE